MNHINPNSLAILKNRYFLNYIKCLVLCSVSFSNFGYCNANFYKIPTTFSVNYIKLSISAKFKDGSSVKMRCKDPSANLCTVFVIIDGRKKSFFLDFKRYSAEPSFETIALAGNSLDDFTFSTSVKCIESDNRHMKAGQFSDECSIVFTIEDGELNFEEIELRSVSDPVRVKR